MSFYQLILTRLHARYDKAALTEDLVFRVSPPIEGGRGVPGADLQSLGLPIDAKSSAVNNFQGRYVIRHPWTGEIKCVSPTRGHWGENPDPLLSLAPTVARSATNLAFASGNGVNLDTMLAKAVPSLGVAPSPESRAAATTDASTRGASDASVTTNPPAQAPATTRPKSGCGCTTSGSSRGALGPAVALALWIARPRRRRRK